MPELRFGVLVVPDAPFPILAERWRRVEGVPGQGAAPGSESQPLRSAREAL